MAVGETNLPAEGQVPPPPWKEDEKKFRRSEVRQGKVSAVVQVLIAFAALAATFVAYRAATSAKEAVEVAAAGVEHQAVETRLSTALSAIGAGQAAQRVGGFALLRRHVQSQVSAATTEEERLDAHRLYTAALDVLENYLRNPPNVPADPATAGLGYGKPPIPDDNRYAANELRAMVALSDEVNALGIDPAVSPGPSVDLSAVQLYGQSWSGIDFSWLTGHNFPHIDLRGANLIDSSWGATSQDPDRLEGSSLAGAFLQCADISGAKFIETDLTGADLRGANLSGADFTDAVVDDVDFAGVFHDGNNPPTGLDPLPESTVGDWEGRQRCLDRPEYHDKPEGR